MPLTIWAFFVTAILGVLSFPVLVSGFLLLMFDRVWELVFSSVKFLLQGQVLDRVGGSPILFQHLFWFLGHPEVYIIILPAMGIVSEVLSVHARKPIFGYRAMVLFNFGDWLLFIYCVGTPHVYVWCESILSNFFVVFTLIIAVPSAVKVFNWISTLYTGDISIQFSRCYLHGFRIYVYFRWIDRYFLR